MAVSLIPSVLLALVLFTELSMPVLVELSALLTLLPKVTVNCCFSLYFVFSRIGSPPFRFRIASPNTTIVSNAIKVRREGMSIVDPYVVIWKSHLV